MTKAGGLHVTLYVDGASKGNPGHAGIGVRMEADGEVVQEYGGYIGRATNNAAEYQALLRGLRMARELGVARVSVKSDSELVVKQINGSYRVKNASLLPLYKQVRDLSRAFQTFEIRHISRSENSAADKLANEGILEWKAAGRPPSPS